MEIIWKNWERSLRNSLSKNQEKMKVSSKQVAVLLNKKKNIGSWRSHREIKRSPKRGLGKYSELLSRLKGKKAIEMKLLSLVISWKVKRKIMTLAQALMRKNFRKSKSNTSQVRVMRRLKPAKIKKREMIKCKKLTCKIRLQTSRLRRKMTSRSLVSSQIKGS